MTTLPCPDLDYEILLQKELDLLKETLVPGGRGGQFPFWCWLHSHPPWLPRKWEPGCQGTAVGGVRAPSVTDPCARSAGQWRFQDDSRLGLRFSDGIQAETACGSAQRAGPWVTEIPKTLRGDGVPSSSPGPGRASAPQSSRNQGVLTAVSHAGSGHGSRRQLTAQLHWRPTVSDCQQWGEAATSPVPTPHLLPWGASYLKATRTRAGTLSVFACQTKVVQAPGFKSRGGAITVKNNHFSFSNF